MREPESGGGWHGGEGKDSTNQEVRKKEEVGDSKRLWHMLRVREEKVEECHGVQCGWNLAPCPS